MPSWSRSAPAVIGDLVAALREDLLRAGYTAPAVSLVLGPPAEASLARGSRLAALRALAGSGPATSSPLEDLTALFTVGRPVPTERVDAALPSLGAAGAEALGLVRLQGGRAHPLVELRAHQLFDSDGVGEWWVASDVGEAVVGGPLPADHVLGVGGASRTLAGLQLPRPAGSLLDLGTGSGIQALRAARYANRIVATDVSERALAYARFNAALNGIELDLRKGSLFEPVDGERFDRIVSNPPFVITPRDDALPAYEYRDAGLVGDRLVEDVVHGVARHLRRGGVAQLLANWEDQEAAAGRDRVARWAEEAGLDVWIVEREVQDPVLYAETWIRDGGVRPGTPQFDRMLEAWIDDFAARGVNSIGFGFVTLRLAETRRFRRVEQVQGGSGGLGGHLAACLDAQDWLAGADDGLLLASRLVVAGDVTEERHYWPGDEHPAAIELRQGGGFARVVPVDAATAGFVGACDGELPVAAIVAALAELLDIEETAIRAELLATVRELVATGFLVPAVQ